MFSPGVKQRARRERHRLAAVRIMQCDLRSACGSGLDRNLSVNVRNFPAHVALANGKVCDARLVPGFNPHLPPVPLVTKRGPQSQPYSYAGLRMYVLHRLSSSVAMGRRSHKLRRFNRRGKDNPKLIHARMQTSLCGDAPDTESIVRIKNLCSVKVDLRSGIKAVKDKIDIAACKHRRSHIEGGTVLPTRVFDPLQLRFVVAKKRVGNLFVGQQIEMYIAGNRRGKPSGFSRLPRHNLAKLPPMIEDENSVFSVCG